MRDPRHKRKRIGSVDGMLIGGIEARRQTDAETSLGTGRSQQTKPNEQIQLDNFKASDGFHPTRQSVINTPANSLTDLGRPLGRQPKRGLGNKIDMTLPLEAKKPRKKILKTIRDWPKRKYLVFPLIIVLIIGFLVVKGYWRVNQVFRGGGSAAALQDDVDPSKLRTEGDGRINILLLGKGGPEHTAPDLTDTILIASLDPINKKAGLLSVPRDLWIANHKINEVYADAKSAALYKGKKADDAEEAGLAAIDKEVENHMGIPIHYHAIVDFEAFRKAIDTVGGVDITVSPQNTVYEQLWDEKTNRNYILDVKAGQQHFDGQRALFYARSRETSQRGDFDRTERQRLILLALKSKVISLGTLSNPSKISSLLDAFGNHVRTNLTTSEMLRIYDLGKDVTSDNVTSIGLADPPNNYVITDNVAGISIVRPRAGLNDYSDIQAYVRNALRDGFLAKENAKVVVLNGTTQAGLGNLKAKELKSYGYNVTKIDTAPTQNYKNTILVDLKNGANKYTKYYLEKRLGVSAVNQLPDNNIVPGDADFVIIVAR